MNQVSSINKRESLVNINQKLIVFKINFVIVTDTSYIILKQDSSYEKVVRTQ